MFSPEQLNQIINELDLSDARLTPTRQYAVIFKGERIVIKNRHTFRSAAAAKSSFLNWWTMRHRLSRIIELPLFRTAEDVHKYRKGLKSLLEEMLKRDILRIIEVNE